MVGAIFLLFLAIQICSGAKVATIDTLQDGVYRIELCKERPSCSADSDSIGFLNRTCDYGVPPQSETYGNTVGPLLRTYSQTDRWLTWMVSVKNKTDDAASISMMNDYTGKGTPRCIGHYISDYYTQEKHRSHCKDDEWAERVHLHKEEQIWTMKSVSPGSDCFYIINPIKPEICWRYLSASDVCEEKYLKLSGEESSDELKQWRFVGNTDTPEPAPEPEPEPEKPDYPTRKEFEEVKDSVSNLENDVKALQGAVSGLPKMSDLTALSNTLNQRIDGLDSKIASLPTCSCPTPTPTPIPSPPPPPGQSPSPPPPPPSPPSKPTAVSISDSSSGSLTIKWTDGSPAGSPGENYRVKCVAAGGVCADTPIGNQVTGLPKYQISYSITGLTKNTDYTCFVIAYNTEGEVCSDPADGKTKATITEFGTPEGVTLFETSQNTFVAWVTDYNTRTSSNPSSLTYCTVDSTGGADSWEFLGCSFITNSDLRGPSGIVLYEPPAPSKPIIISAQIGTGYTVTCLLNEANGVNDACGPNNVNFPGTRDIVLNTISGTTSAYTTDAYGGSSTAEIVRYPINELGNNAGKVVYQANVAPADIWGLAIDSQSQRLYYVTPFSSPEVHVCELDGSGDVTGCLGTYPGTYPYLYAPKDILIDTSQTPARAYITYRNGVMKCDVDSNDGTLSNCGVTGDPTKFDIPYGMYIAAKTGWPTKMYITNTRGDSVTICNIDSTSAGALDNCKVM